MHKIEARATAAIRPHPWDYPWDYLRDYLRDYPWDYLRDYPWDYLWDYPTAAAKVRVRARHGSGHGSAYGGRDCRHRAEPVVVLERVRRLNRRRRP